MSIKYGDTIDLGDHRLICGSCTDPEIIKKLVGDRKINLIVTDPPYGVDYVESKKEIKNSKFEHKAIANDQIQSDQSYQSFTQLWLDAVKPFLSPKNSFYIFNSDRMLFALKNALDTSNFKFCQLLIWIKNHAVIGRLDYLPQHELIAYGWHGTHKFFKSKDKSVLFFPKPQKSSLHPTMKPISLTRHLILNSSQIGNYVFDGFGGSGTTLLACEQTKRKCLMVELDPKYCEVIIDRYQRINKP
jgi:site-specific DNA-methyltransferase (adenine-specific)